MVASVDGLKPFLATSLFGKYIFFFFFFFMQSGVRVLTRQESHTPELSMGWVYPWVGLGWGNYSKSTKI